MVVEIDYLPGPNNDNLGAQLNCNAEQILREIRRNFPKCQDLKFQIEADNPKLKQTLTGIVSPDHSEAYVKELLEHVLRKSIVGHGMLKGK